MIYFSTENNGPDLKMEDALIDKALDLFKTAVEDGHDYVVLERVKDTATSCNA